jgi:sRNA-binding protein
VDPEEAKRKAAEDRKAKQAASLREREEKVRRDKLALERATGKSRADAGREGSEREFKTLLIDAVRDHDVSIADIDSHAKGHQLIFRMLAGKLERDPAYITTGSPL